MARPPTDATVPDTPSAAGTRERPEGLPPRYRLLDVIGEGGMGRVYRAYDTTLGREVAIKLIEQDLHGADKTLQRERFVREARAAARLEHPNIVAVHDVDPEAGWLAMELVAGESLRDVVARGASAPAFVRKVAEQVLAALDAAHAAGVVHRDIKPSNIMVDATGKVTLVDFGVARLVDAELTRTGESLGTPAYMAPEQLRGAKVDERTDLYGLGATLYELVSGERMVAFESPSVAALARLDSQCPGEPGLAHVIGRCLQADPNARFPSARDAALALAKHRRRIRWALPAAIVMAAVAIVGVLWLTRRDAPTPDPRMAELFTMAQRGEPAKALIGLEAYLAEHPDDADALTLKMLAYWWKQGRLEEADVRKVSPRVRPAQRAMLHGILLMTQKRDDAAIAYLESAERDHPNSVEITYALGEARWHGQQLERGVADLERAYLRDSHWQMALHHVIEHRLPRGEAARLRPLADKLRAVDPPAAAALDCRISIGERAYAKAASDARTALEHQEPIPELYLCLSQAQVLAGDLAAAEQTAKHAIDRWPIDLREWGLYPTYAESFLYRGRLDEFLDLDKGARQHTITLATWRWSPELGELPPTGPGMRAPPFNAALWFLTEHLHGRDPVAIYGTYLDPEVRAYARALSAEQRGDTAAALADYRKALEVPAKGDIRMMVAHRIARILHASGDKAGVAAACEEIIAPRMYLPYRAVLLPDCLLWSEDPVLWKQLVDAWTGTFEHPAVVEARRRLAER